MNFDYANARDLMVEQQVRPWDVLDARVLDVLATVPRDRFVADAHRSLAYADLALPTAHGEVMMKPVVEGRMLQALDLKPEDQVLEIGTGSGFIAACLGQLARTVTTLERHADLVTAAETRLAGAGMGANIDVVHADAFAWDAGSRRFDAVCVTGAVATIPTRFMDWLRPGGRLFVIRGVAPVMEAVLVTAPAVAGGTPAIASLFETELPYLAGAGPVARFEL
ncbi:MAG TPA: protein-L-isoaspartate O-methyltransferase [Xanthomonadaceae bacterium]|nr:protein-L-isoaspartate O-methyltransferase [Xanthomonadaceae bacterium]